MWIGGMLRMQCRQRVFKLPYAAAKVGDSAMQVLCRGEDEPGGACETTQVRGVVRDVTVFLVQWLGFLRECKWPLGRTSVQIVLTIWAQRRASSPLGVCQAWPRQGI